MTLRQLRQARGYTLKDVNALTGIAVPTLSMWENNRRNLPIKKAFILANIYNISALQIIASASSVNYTEIKKLIKMAAES